jgi:hypothetical protein
VVAKKMQSQRNVTNEMEPDTMAVVAMKRGENEMKKLFPKV